MEFIRTPAVVNVSSHNCRSASSYKRGCYSAMNYGVNVFTITSALNCCLRDWYEFYPTVCAVHVNMNGVVQIRSGVVSVLLRELLLGDSSSRDRRRLKPC